MKIGEVAKRTGLNISNIRFYERKGLLSPERREDSSYREYTEADVYRIKEILLYRKMGISVESICFILEHKVDLTEVVSNQKKQLEEQLLGLQGSMDLCDMVLKKWEISPNTIDSYLEYVHHEEEKGNRFSEITELLDEITEFTQNGMFYYRPFTFWLIRWPWAVRLLSVCFLGAILGVPFLHIVEIYQGKSSINIPFLVIYFVIIFSYGMGFFQYRRSRRLKEKENDI